ncbi:tetratricopeptide repeat-containing glycosyltransferase family 2 protein [Kineococcus rhizosphaerae]|uniref:tetratricopeptide repeat-containing glycosyltransferase family 2 protein n=1 Tax=Kineococcus rhizosphaerae TaxID=559628 RepID=UPI001475E621|nr:glycosyltransferase family 2 protein [Kineococcus rhizosphaerae]
MSVFISACYIVKDEERVLAASLDAVAPFVDEIVVYDTGSSDGTLEIARSRGAVVVEGHWDDDFGAARNRALEHCRGEWVFSVDADEVVQGDPRAFRTLLRRSAVADVVRVQVANAVWDSVDDDPLTVQMVRVFRRRTCHWTGALHEQVVRRGGERLSGTVSPLVLLHSGYTVQTMAEKGKTDRNLALARRELDRALEDGHHDVTVHRVNFARSALSSRHFQEALDALEPLDGQYAVQPPPADWLPLAASASYCAIQAAASLGRFETARSWIERLQSWGERPGALTRVRASVAMAEGDFRGALDLLRDVTEVTDLRGGRVTEVSLLLDTANCHAALGEYDQAADAMLEHLRRGAGDMPAPQMLAIVHGAHLPVEEFAAAVPPALVVPLLGQLSTLPFAEVSDVLEALLATAPSPAPVLAAAASMWPSMSLPEALPWSLRLREAGHPESCPLLAIAGSAEREPVDRLAAAAVLHEVGDERALSFVEHVLEGWEEATWPLVEQAVGMYSPRLRDLLAASVVEA